MNKDFPNEIDLGSTPPEVADTPVGKNQKGAKPKKFYPSLYISNVEGLEGLPKEGQALIYFKRRRLTQSTTDEGEDHSADLEITKICLPEGVLSEYEDGEDSFDKAARKAGVLGGKHEEPDGDEDEYGNEPEGEEEE